MATMTADLMLVHESVPTSEAYAEAALAEATLAEPTLTEATLDDANFDAIPEQLVVGEHNAPEHPEQEPASERPDQGGWRRNDVSVVIQPNNVGQPIARVDSLGEHLPNSPASPGSLPGCAPLEDLTWVAKSGGTSECMICLEELLEGQLVTCLPCAHNFHNDCILRWFGTKINQHQNGCCPNCNLTIVAPIEERSNSAGSGSYAGARYEGHIPQPSRENEPLWGEDVITGSHCCGKNLSPHARQMCVLISLFWFCCALAGAVFLSVQASGLS
mmetsp:Transcript_17668/g.42864  ORF Transcript_17668/g.42864 Transcript_17668/m.42864 type:complete len:273 (-) Transcript_17668:311-1129(-)